MWLQGREQRKLIERERERERERAYTTIEVRRVPLVFSNLANIRQLTTFILLLLLLVKCLFEDGERGANRNCSMAGKCTTSRPNKSLFEDRKSRSVVVISSLVMDCLRGRP